MLQIQAIDDMPSDAIKEQFREARKPEYAELIKEIQQVKPAAPGFPAQFARLKRRFEEIAEIDFFHCQLRTKAEESLYRMEHPTEPLRLGRGRLSKDDYQNRIWLTRPTPGIDRVASAWFVKQFVDSNPTFVFGSDPGVHLKAVPFDMYQAGGFGHEGENCTFETLVARFGIAKNRLAVTKKQVRLIAQAIHDADLEDNKFGRTEGIAINQVLKGWAKQGVPDDELLRRGMEMIEGLYHSVA